MGCKSIGLQRLRHDWSDLAYTHCLSVLSVARTPPCTKDSVPFFSLITCPSNFPLFCLHFPFHWFFSISTEIYLFYLKKQKTSTSLDTVGSSVSLCFLSIYALGKWVNILYSGFLSFHCILIPLQYGISPIFFKEMAQHSELLQFQRFLHVRIPLFEFLLYFIHKILYSKHPLFYYSTSSIQSQLSWTKIISFM